MPGKRRDGGYPLVGAAVPLIAVIGCMLFGWGFGVGDGTVPLLLGLGAAVVAVGVRLTSGHTTCASPLTAVRGRTPRGQSWVTDTRN